MKKILDNSWILMLTALLITVALLFRQCSITAAQNTKYTNATTIAAQNLAAMGDSTVQLQLTREQLKQSDSNLFKLVYRIDSITKIGDTKNKTLEVINVHPEVNSATTKVKTDIQKDTTLNYDANLGLKYNLDFKVDDSIKSFNGKTTFYVMKKDSTLKIVSDSTFINDFKFNFDLVVVKYDDFKTKVTKYNIVPYFIDKFGGMHILTSGQLKFNFRGIELLDKPWDPFVASPIIPKSKYKLEGAWGIGINPISIHPVMKNGFLEIGYAPSISLGYFLTFRKR